MTFWLSFPISVAPDEDHMAWLIDPPNFDASTSQERGFVSSTLVEAATHLRAIYVNLMTAEHQTERTRSLANGILPHVEKGALDIARSEPSGRSMAVWELNFACEKAVKAYLQQQQIVPPRSHDIRGLHRLASQSVGLSELDNVVELLPSTEDAIKHRYAELPSPSLAESLTIYRVALTILNGYTYRLIRKYTFDNAKFHLKMPPWLKEG